MHLPTADNDGVELSHDSILGRILAIAGGYTAHPAAGAWTDGHHIYRDDLVVVWADTDEANVDVLREVAGDACRQFRQESIYFTATEIDVEFVASWRVPA